jgi:hypothetical protein
VWTLGMNGVWSTTPNIEVTANNYIKGDVSDPAGTAKGEPDGCLSFDPEFVWLAVAYLTSTGDAYFDPYLDFAPTSNGQPDGYSLPDGNVNFEDLVMFALNYRDHRCATKAGEQPRNVVRPGAVASQINVTAEFPSYARAGAEIEVPFRIDNTSGIVGYRMIFEYDRSSMELVSIRPGEAYESIDQSFFYQNEKSNDLDVSSVILDQKDLEGEEFMVATFRMTMTGAISIEEKDLDIRDGQNYSPQVFFNAASVNVLPTEFALSQNYPNPFNPTTDIELALPAASRYELVIYNVIGQEVDRFEGYSDGGFVTITWDASGYSSGVYLYRVVAGEFSQTKKMVLLK